MTGSRRREPLAQMLQGLCKGVGRTLSLGREAVVLNSPSSENWEGEHASGVSSNESTGGSSSLCEHCAKPSHQVKRPAEGDNASWPEAEAA